MPEEHILVVDDEHHHLRLDVFLTQNLPDVPSRTAIRRLIDEGGAIVNGHVVKPHYKVRTGDEVVVRRLQDQECEGAGRVEPEAIPLNIFYEDADLLVINKPVGMLVHPTNNVFSGTLVNALLYHCRDLSDGSAPFRPGIVHRLDRETSGLLLVAKNNRVHVRLSRAFEKRRIRKKYVALVEGNIEFEQGVVDVPVGKHPRHFDMKAISYEEDAKEAKTVYHVLQRANGLTLVALFPESGRTHQLRVHMNYLGHPILGDEKYGKKGSFGRMALHAQAIAFVHPTKQTFIEFSCPVPEEFLAALKKNV